MKDKPLNKKAYGSIPHLPISKMGQGDKRVHKGQADICCLKKRDKKDEIIVQEKLDGSCVSVARINDELISLGRAGYRASESPHKVLRDFSKWADENCNRFEFLNNNERIIGEWLDTPHGTIYNLPHEPFVAFDIMNGTERLIFDEFNARAKDFIKPKLFHRGDSYPLHRVFYDLYESGHGAKIAEGVVYRVERDLKVDFLAKFVRPDFVPGKYFDANELEAELQKEAGDDIS